MVAFVPAPKDAVHDVAVHEPRVGFHRGKRDQKNADVEDVLHESSIPGKVLYRSGFCQSNLRRRTITLFVIRPL